jgi:Mn-containing catalase
VESQAERRKKKKREEGKERERQEKKRERRKAGKGEGRLGFFMMQPPDLAGSPWSGAFCDWLGNILRNRDLHDNLKPSKKVLFSKRYLLSKKGNNFGAKNISPFSNGVV